MLNSTTNTAKYDVAIIGAGPAGCECARSIAKAGHKVLLIEKAKSFSSNNYSSGGAPLEIKEDFAISEEAIGTYWHKLAIHTSNDSHVWTSEGPKGIILDFMKLRSSLSSEAASHGCTLRMHTAYVRHEQYPDHAAALLKNLDSKDCYSISAKVLVDASGVERKVLAGSNYDTSKAMTATGIEYLIEVPQHIYGQYAGTLSFFLGLKWMPQGYAWIFPMQPNLLKAGVIRYFPKESWAPYENSYTFYLDRLIKECLKTSQPKIIDRHGKTMAYTYGQKDILYNHRILAAGDSMSSLNPLACEGIRHAMACGRIASKHILDALRNNSINFIPYARDLKRYFGYKWTASEALMKQFYRQSRDENIDLFLNALKWLSFDQLIDLGFHYKPAAALKFYIAYQTAMAKNDFKRIFSSGWLS